MSSSTIEQLVHVAPEVEDQARHRLLVGRDDVSGAARRAMVSANPGTGL